MPVLAWHQLTEFLAPLKSAPLQTWLLQLETWAAGENRADPSGSRLLQGQKYVIQYQQHPSQRVYFYPRWEYCGRVLSVIINAQDACALCGGETGVTVGFTGIRRSPGPPSQLV